MGNKENPSQNRHPKWILFEICLWWRILLNHLPLLSFMRVFRGTGNQRQFDASTESHVREYRALLRPNMRMYEGFKHIIHGTWRLILVCHLTAGHLFLEMWTPNLGRLFLESKYSLIMLYDDRARLIICFTFESGERFAKTVVWTMRSTSPMVPIPMSRWRFSPAHAHQSS